MKSFYYRKLASEKQIDEGFKKYVIQESDDYKNFESKFQENMEQIINPKNFRLWILNGGIFQ